MNQRRAGGPGGARPSLAVVLLVFLWGCGSDPTDTTEDVLAEVTLSPQTSSLTFDERVRYTATARTTSGRELTNLRIRWASSDSSVVVVTSGGLVTGVGPGQATITATVEDVVGSGSVQVQPLSFAVLSAGTFHTCGLTTEGTVYCWGFQYGVRGAPVAVSREVRFRSLTSGRVHTCGLTTDDTAVCWGSNDHGQLGIGVADDAFHEQPQAVTGGITFTSLTAGGLHTCGITEGIAYCWGLNAFGQLGNDDTQDVSEATQVVTDLTFQSLSAGNRQSCGISVDRIAHCWGTNSTTINSSVPEALPGGITLESVTAGDGHACGLTAEGSTYCWGTNVSGQLGNGLTTLSAEPVLVSGGSVAAEVSAGWSHTCHVSPQGDLSCWGFNDAGQLGNGSVDRLPHTVPEAVAGGLTFRSVTGGLSHTCGLTTDGLAYCWGGDTHGQLGAGTRGTDRTTPTLVLGQR